MKKIGVEPQVYLLRWIRCMLSREYRMSDAIIVWDAIYAFYYQNNAEHTTLEMMDFLCLGMLQFVRHDLLMKDDSSLCYARLMKYPPVENIASIISLGLKCKASLSNTNSDLKDFQKQDFMDRSIRPTELRSQDSGEIRSPTQTVTSTTNSKSNVILFAPGYLKKPEKAERAVANSASPDPQVQKRNEPLSSTIQTRKPLLDSPQFQTQPPVKRENSSGEKSLEESNWLVYNKIQDALELLKKEQSTKPSSNLETAIRDLTVANEMLFESTSCSTDRASRLEKPNPFVAAIQNGTTTPKSGVNTSGSFNPFAKR